MSPLRGFVAGRIASATRVSLLRGYEYLVSKRLNEWTDVDALVKPSPKGWHPCSPEIRGIAGKPRRGETIITIIPYNLAIRTEFAIPGMYPVEKMHEP